MIVDYDPGWPVRFEEERRLIAQALSGLAVAIEHVGSTSVPGLAAKPVIDIMVAIRAFEDGERCVAPLEALRYEYRGDGGIPGRHYFRKGEPRSHHMHMVVYGGEFWERHIAFRDLLRADRALADAYAALKRELAAQHGAGRIAYTEAKTPFIEAALAGQAAR